MELTMSKEDTVFNNERLAEQKEIRKKGVEFVFNLRYTCPLCGRLFVPKHMRLK
jgi:hypothetical protein